MHFLKEVFHVFLDNFILFDFFLLTFIFSVKNWRIGVFFCRRDKGSVIYETHREGEEGGWGGGSQDFCISFFIPTVLHILFCSLSNNSKYQLAQTWSIKWPSKIHALAYDRFKTIQSNLRIMKLRRVNQGFNFLGGSFSNRDDVRAPIWLHGQFRNVSFWARGSFGVPLYYRGGRRQTKIG